MRLAEAFQIIGQSSDPAKVKIHLLLGITPLHLETFSKARLMQHFQGAGVDIATGLYGDLEGNVRRACDETAHSAIVVIEWSDIDQRLGIRSSAGWRAETLNDIVNQAEAKCRRLASQLHELATRMPVIVAGPTLTLPPMTYQPPSEESDFELRLKLALAQFLLRAANHHAIRLISDTQLALTSPIEGRHDVNLDLHAGFPYTLKHADALAGLFVQSLFPPAPKKGIITDLDQTLWRGILGDVGVEGINWALEGKSQGHALYQQLLASLADSGVLVAVASKNDPGIVEEAFRRPDILLQSSSVFPMEVGWGVKSEAVGRILQTWNIGPDSVVFVDDSPMELAEVGEKYPAVECLRFPSDNPGAIVDLLWRLRTCFGKREILEEDRLRLASIRNFAEHRSEEGSEVSADFLSRIEGKVTLESAGSDQRAFELVNKTNQFNLNGVRYSEAEWKTLAQRPGAFLATVSYEDRFGPLGRIAVLGGYCTDDACHVDVWVMSCRAFSRHIEFQAIRQLFSKTSAAEIRFRFKSTERNGPLKSFFAHFELNGSTAEGELVLRAEDFGRLCPR